MLTQAEKIERLEAMQDAMGTHRAEGIELDATVQALMRRFAEGELTLAQFSAAMDRHAEQVLAAQRSLVGAA
jgi:hypothetical protein